MIENLNDILKIPMNELCDYVPYFDAHSCLSSICKLLDIPDDKKLKIVKNIESSYGSLSSLTLSELRIICLSKYLLFKFKSLAQNRVQQNLLKYHRHVNENSLSVYVSIIDLMYNQMNMSPNKIIHNGQFLMVDLENTYKIATQLKSVVGVYVFDMLLKSPTTMKTKYSQILDNYNLIKR